jgi:hypothetical protein
MDLQPLKSISISISSRQRGYAMGMIDGMLLAPLFGAPEDGEKLKSLATCVTGMNDEHMRAIFDSCSRIILNAGMSRCTRLRLVPSWVHCAKK